MAPGQCSENTRQEKVEVLVTEEQGHSSEGRESCARGLLGELENLSGSLLGGKIGFQSHFKLAVCLSRTAEFFDHDWG